MTDIAERRRNARKRHDSPGKMTQFDKELRQASQQQVPCRYRIGPDDDWISVTVKYVDPYFIKVEPDFAEGGRPRWLNKAAIYEFEIGGG